MVSTCWPSAVSSGLYPIKQQPRCELVDPELGLRAGIAADSVKEDSGFQMYSWALHCATRPRAEGRKTTAAAVPPPFPLHQVDHILDNLQHPLPQGVLAELPAHPHPPASLYGDLTPPYLGSGRCARGPGIAKQLHHDGFHLQPPLHRKMKNETCASCWAEVRPERVREPWLENK